MTRAVKFSGSDVWPGKPRSPSINKADKWDHMPTPLNFASLLYPRFPGTLAARYLCSHPASARLLITSLQFLLLLSIAAPGDHRRQPASVSTNSSGPIPPRRSNMYLQYYINEKGDKVYTTKKESPLGVPTQSAHPARFSPDDKYSRQRYLLKKRFGLLPTQQPAPKY